MNISVRMERKKVMAGMLCGIVFGSLWMPLALNMLIRMDVEKKRRLLCMWLIFLVQIIASVIAMLTGYSEIGLLCQFPVIGLLIYFILGRRQCYLLYIPVAYILIVICNYITEVVFIKVMQLSVQTLEGSTFYTLILNCVITVVTVLFSGGVQKVIGCMKKSFFSKISKAMVFLISGNILLCMGVFLINGRAARRLDYPDSIVETNLLIFTLYAILAIILSLIVFKVYREREQMEHEKQEQNNLQEYIKQVEGMYEGLRTFKHDYINILAALSGYLEDEDYSGLKKYFDEYIMPTNQKINRDNYRLIQLSNVKQSSIKGILASKLIYAHTIGVDVYIDIIEEIDGIGINPVDFARIIGVYLDNAIEAVNECEIKEIKLNIVRGDNSITVTIMNTFIDHGIPISQYEKKYFSTKGVDRGLGLYNVKEILRQYKNIYKFTEIRDGYFVQTLVIENWKSI